MFEQAFKKAMTQLYRVMAWFRLARRSDGAGLAVSDASAVTERREGMMIRLCLPLAC